MAEPFIAEIRMGGFNFPPRGNATCDGQILSIAQNTALFALLGTTYGGNGQTTFALPDLRGAAPMHAGSGAGLTQRVLGDVGGTESVTVTAAQMPAHTHSYSGENANAVATAPGANFPAANRSINAYTAPTAPGITLAPMSAQGVAAAGGSQPHNNLQPYLVINFYIALEGIFPPRG